MDPILVCSVAIIIVLIALILTFIYKISFGGKTHKTVIRPQTSGEENRQQQQQRVPVIIGGRRQAQVARRRVVAAADHNDERRAAVNRAPAPYENDDQSDFEGESFDPDDLLYSDGKIGKKKAAKLQAKAEKKAQREVELEDREDRKKREAEKLESAKIQEEKEKQEELARKEFERKAKEEKDKKEFEEYLKMKQAFSVEEEGYDLEETKDSENILQEFIQFVKKTKVVNMDELAARFKLKPHEAVDRLKTFVSSGLLTGVMDDRGKFIFITEQELLAVAKFINQRGRVSVPELAEYSNKLINLEPES